MFRVAASRGSADSECITLYFVATSVLTSGSRCSRGTVTAQLFWNVLHVPCMFRACSASVMQGMVFIPHSPAS